MTDAAVSTPAGWPTSRQMTDVLIGVLVPPVLLGLMVARGLADGLAQAGLASEQVFAGERLPTLNLATPDREG